MKKKLIFGLCLCLAAGSLSACGADASSADGGQSQKAGMKGELSLLTSGSNYNDCAAEHGYYYLNEEGDHIMYVDYESRKELYLCSRPGCKHDTEECPSYINETERLTGNSLFYYKDHLYLFSHDFDNDGTTAIDYLADGSEPMGDLSVVSSPAALYQMNPDGTERKKVCSFDEGAALEDTVLCDDSGLYFIEKRLTSEQVDDQTTTVSSKDRKLIRVDTSQWKQEEVCDMDEQSGIIGCYGGKLVVCSVQYQKELTAEEKLDDDIFTEALNESKSVYALFDPATEESREIYSVKNDRINNALLKGKYLYAAAEGDGDIKKIDVETGEATVFVKTQNNNLNGIYEDVLACSSWDTADSASYYIHLDDGVIERSDLKNRYKDYPLEVRAETPDGFLVVCDYDAHTDPVYPDQDNIEGIQFALIDKADLYSGTENYEKIEMTSKGL